MIRATAPTVAVLAAAAAMLAPAGAAGAATSSGAVPAAQSAAKGEIEMGASGLCLTTLRGRKSAGTPVVLKTCRAAANQRWAFLPDQTVRLLGRPNGEALSVDPTTSQVVLGDPASPDSQWFPQADRTLVNIGMSPTPQKQLVLLWLPGTAGGQLLVNHRESGKIAKGWEVFTAPGTKYATTRLTNRPDSGGGSQNGGNWALDDMIRQSSVTRLGGHNYEGSVVDAGTFTAFPGASTPNAALDPGKTIGDSLRGALAGTWGYSFTATSSPDAARVPRKVNGLADPSGSWYELFFGKGTAFGGPGGYGNPPTVTPMDWSWSYTSVRDNCGAVETWLDASNDNGGQNATGPYATDITAPAPGCP